MAKVKFKIKAHDSEEENYTYMDQDYIELYDAYDLGAKEPVPQIVLDSNVRKVGRSTKYVDVNYPVVSQIFTLDGKKGAHFNYIEAGKKAYVRGGKYKHPVKGWRSKIVMMTPMEYIEECYNIFKRRGSSLNSVDELIDAKEREYDLFKVFDPLAGDLNYLVLEYNKKAQEGLHRAIYALRKNIDKVPVVVII